MSIVFNFTSQYVSYRIAKGVCESARRVNITHKQTKDFASSLGERISGILVVCGIVV